MNLVPHDLAADETKAAFRDWVMSDELTDFALARFAEGVAKAVEEQKRLGIICKSG